MGNRRGKLPADEPITVAFTAPMTATQRAWLNRTRAQVRSIIFDPRDYASGELLTDHPRLHACLEEAYDVRVECTEDLEWTKLRHVAVLRVLSLQLEGGGSFHDLFMMALLPRGLRQLTYIGTHKQFGGFALVLQHLDQLQVCIPTSHGLIR